MIEVLVSLLIIVLGLLGLAGLQTRLQQAEFESYQRSQALVLLYDMVDRINFNRETASCFAITTAADGTAYYGTGVAAPTACGVSTTENQNRAKEAMLEWDSMLDGTAETKDGVAAGAMAGARGCVSLDAATGIYTVSVAWQGTGETVVPTVNCANGLYGATDERRRVVSTTFRMATLK